MYSKQTLESGMIQVLSGDIELATLPQGDDIEADLLLSHLNSPSTLGDGYYSASIGSSRNPDYTYIKDTTGMVLAVTTTQAGADKVLVELNRNHHAEQCTR